MELRHPKEGCVYVPPGPSPLTFHLWPLTSYKTIRLQPDGLIIFHASPHPRRTLQLNQVPALLIVHNGG